MIFDICVCSESNSPVRDYSSLINPRNRGSQLTSDRQQNKPVRFLDRKRRTTVEEVGRQANNVHIHSFQEVGAKVCSLQSVGVSVNVVVLRRTGNAWQDTCAAASCRSLRSSALPLTLSDSPGST